MKFKKLRFLTLLIMSMFILTGCKNKTMISAGEFKSKMESKNYVITDATNQFSSNSEIKQVYIAQEKSGNYQIEFYQLDNVDNAVSFYKNNKEIFESSKSNSNTYSDVTLKNYAKYTLKTNGEYKVLSRIDNTVIYINVDSKYNDNIDKILKELGY